MFKLKYYEKCCGVLNCRKFKVYGIEYYESDLLDEFVFVIE